MRKLAAGIINRLLNPFWSHLAPPMSFSALPAATLQPSNSCLLLLGRVGNNRKHITRSITLFCSISPLSQHQISKPRFLSGFVAGQVTPSPYCVLSSHPKFFQDAIGLHPGCRCQWQLARAHRIGCCWNPKWYKPWIWARHGQTARCIQVEWNGVCSKTPQSSVFVRHFRH